MQAAHIGLLEMLSAAAPVKMSGAVSSSSTTKSFSMAWQQELSARTQSANAAVGGSAAGLVASGRTTQNEASPTLAAAVKSATEAGDAAQSKIDAGNALNVTAKNATSSADQAAAGLKEDALDATAQSVGSSTDQVVANATLKSAVSSADQMEAGLNAAALNTSALNVDAKNTQKSTQSNEVAIDAGNATTKASLMGATDQTAQSLKGKQAAQAAASGNGLQGTKTLINTSSTPVAATPSTTTTAKSAEVQVATISIDAESNPIEATASIATAAASAPFAASVAEARIPLSVVAAAANQVEGTQSSVGESSQTMKSVSAGTKRETASVAREKDKNSVAKSAAVTDGESAATVSATTVSVTPELMAQLSAGQTGGASSVTASGSSTKSDESSADVTLSGSSHSGKAVSSATVQSDSVTAGAETKDAFANSVQAASESSAATAGQVTNQRAVSAGKVATARREATAGKDAAATNAVQSEAKAGAGLAVAASSTGVSGSHAHLNASQADSTGLQAVSTGTSGVVAATQGSTLSGSSSAGAELLNAAANPADGVASSGHQVLSSTPTKLEVGVFDGTHGWLQIRAELGTSGTVNASLTTSSVAHDAVKATVPEMSSYLQSESVNVSNIAVHRIAEMPNAMNATSGDGQQNGGAQGQHSARDNSGASQGSAPMASGSDTGSGSTSGSGTTSAGTDNSAVGAVSSDAVGSNEISSSTADTSDWVGGLSGAMPLAGAAGGAWGSSSGSWLNVRA